jgi:tripartite-type tricarboxylate transporter receptor subunit TctC
MLTRRQFIAGAGIASILFSCFLSCLLSWRPALAQAYPTQTIRIIAGYPSGGRH